ncbi:hypothetical protein HYW74_00370 [Candidatus Pacearchaeota archaeon]|nr:hypothetical protein [Candidatus Pacearchaeota archaeon]
MEFRKSTLSEREQFYNKEFSVAKLKAWFKKNNLQLPQLCAVDAGSESGIILDKKNKDIMLYFKFSELQKKIKKYMPEDVYYDRNRYKNPDKILKTLDFNNLNNRLSEELVFDIDIDNLGLKGKNELSDSNLRKLYEIALKMRKELLNMGFKKVGIVYSGRGFHAHVFDKKASLLSVKQRDELNKKLRKYPIDPWVSRGYIRLIRMPYSLHGLVSRVVTPVNVSKGFEIKKTMPRFMK